ncbi:MAG: cytochrome B [Cyclobacteriaceae bacterium]|nr:cytochrome B [Cyclobacteriaceae bacterium]
MYKMLLHSHSGLRWILIALLIAAIFNALTRWLGGKEHREKDRKLALFAMVFTHIQLLLGLILYVISPKVIFAAESMKSPITRFFLVEHITVMLIAIALITIGYVKAKKVVEDDKKFRRIFVYYLAGFVLMMIAIPWPFYNYGAGWF